MRQSLGGVLAPVTTPFSAATGDLSRADFERNLEAHLAAGLAGVVVAGSTGEGALLDERERGLLAEWARPIVPEGRWLLAGTGAESTRLTIARCRTAAEMGVDAVLVVAPHYYGSATMTAAALENHFARVADASPVPVVLYNIPKYMHFTLTPALVSALAEHENIIGIKDSSGDLALLGEYIAGAQGDSFSVLTGNGGQLVEALGRGARGAILAVSVFTGTAIPELLSHLAAGSEEAARTQQARLTTLAQEIVGAMGPAGVKAALDAVGLAGGPVREPLMPLDEPGRRRVMSLLDTAGLTPA